MNVELVIRGERQAIALLDRLARRLHDGTPQLFSLVDQLIEAERERFAGRGIRWRKLAPSTIRRKRDPRPLVNTGELMRSLTTRGHAQQLVTVRPGELRFGTRLWYAQFPQKGKGQPKRTVVGLTRLQRKSVVHELRDLLVEGL